MVLCQQKALGATVWRGTLVGAYRCRVLRL